MSSHPVTLADVQMYLTAHELSPLDEDHQAEGWITCEVEVASLRECHGNFKGRPLPEKGILFTGLVDQHRDQILAGEYPDADRPELADEIRRDWDVEPPLIVVLEDGKGDLYVMDGAGRAHNAVWTGRRRLHAFVFREEGEREVATYG